MVFLTKILIYGQSRYYYIVYIFVVFDVILVWGKTGLTGIILAALTDQVLDGLLLLLSGNY